MNIRWFFFVESIKANHDKRKIHHEKRKTSCRTKKKKRVGVYVRDREMNESQ
jgi:hypothetical protein